MDPAKQSGPHRGTPGREEPSGKIMLQDFMLEYLQPLALQRLDADAQ